MLSSRRVLVWLFLAIAIAFPIFSQAQSAKEGVSSGLAFNATFPKNQFNIITLDESTDLRIVVKNTGNDVRTIFGVSGVLTDPKDPKQVVQNVTAQRYSKEVRPGKEITLTYKLKLHREGEAGLVVFVDFYDGEEAALRAVAYQGEVKVQYNDSIFDLQSISIYLILLGFVGGAGYLAYQSFFAPAQTGRPKRRPLEPVTPAKVLPPGQADLDWIPEHLQKAEKARQSPKLKKRGTK
ncbi:hypothetical protein HDV00_010505 [Rhizophlyctis rosea]|nr:hypothetical protein HDV00_010505 [Rhizophlyctis rosea]